MAQNLLVLGCADVAPTPIGDDMRMAIVESTHGTWNYCPFDALPILGLCMRYGDEGFSSLDACVAAMARDKSLLGGYDAQVVIVE
jgi:hypothetical protein